jgi:FeS assembly SUF system protein
LDEKIKAETKSGEPETNGKAGTDENKEVPAEKTDLNDAVLEALKSCYDPEIPVNIYELGLIYAIHINEEGKVDIDMTLTSPACPVAGSLPPEVENKVKSIPGVSGCNIRLVWDPPWDMSMMSEEAKLHLNLY